MYALPLSGQITNVTWISIVEIEFDFPSQFQLSVGV